MSRLRNCCLSLVIVIMASHGAAAEVPEGAVAFKGEKGPGAGKKIVLISGDEEYRSEEMLPQLGKILAKHHGFDCVVLFAIDKKDGTINPMQADNIPGTKALDDADLMVIFTRFRNLPEAQMQPIVDYLAKGKPVVGIRTATHAFNYPGDNPFAKYGWTSKVSGWEGGFGRQVLGETWVAHHGSHGRESQRGIVSPENKDHPIVRGIADGDIWGPSDVYTVRLPLAEGAVPLVYGQVLTGMNPTDPPVQGKKNDPMMPIAWTRKYQLGDADKAGRAFTSTMGSSQDFSSEGFRRLLVNACYWALGMEDQIPPKSNVSIVGSYEPTRFRAGGYVKGIKPADHAFKQ